MLLFLLLNFCMILKHFFFIYNQIFFGHNLCLRIENAAIKICTENSKQEIVIIVIIKEYLSIIYLSYLKK